MTPARTALDAACQAGRGRRARMAGWLPRGARRRACLAGLGLLALGACGNLDFDLRDRTGAFGTAEAARQPTAPRPAPDARGVISYPTYQVAVASRGDTVETVAARVGLSSEELARFNGIDPGIELRQGEVLALPRRVSEPPGGFASAPSAGPGGAVDVTTLAGAAIDRAAARPGSATPAGTIAPPRGSTEPVRHQVVRGETAYSIARLYGISVRSLADWNGLGPDLTVREGSYLIIPQAGAAAPADATPPGAGSPTPVPPSATTPLPAEDEIAAVAVPPSPALGAERGAAASGGKLAMPVAGSIIRAFDGERSKGIDIAAGAGSEVRASEAGRVAAVTRDTSGIQLVIIRHEGAPLGFSEPILTVYANLDGITVERDARVTRGQVIGKVAPGNPAFLHFEVRRGFETLDPAQFLE